YKYYSIFVNSLYTINLLIQSAMKCHPKRKQIRYARYVCRHMKHSISLAPDRTSQSIPVQRNYFKFEINANKIVLTSVLYDFCNSNINPFFLLRGWQHSTMVCVMLKLFVLLDRNRAEVYEHNPRTIQDLKQEIDV
ncbi:hypothetical protein L9F63_026596, partial [Diploptera punctata]